MLHSAQFLLTPGCCWSPEPEEPEVGSEAGEEGKVPEWEPELLQEEEELRTEGLAVEGSRRSGPAARTGHDKELRELQDLREPQEPELQQQVEVEHREEEPGGEDTGRTERAGIGRGRAEGGRRTVLLEEELEDHQ